MASQRIIIAHPVDVLNKPRCEVSMTKDEAMRMAIDVLEICNGAETVEGYVIYTDEEIEALRIALAQPKKEWVGLTGEEILEEYRQSYGDDGNLTDVYFARAIESKLKEKNI